VSGSAREAADESTPAIDGRPPVLEKLDVIRVPVIGVGDEAVRVVAKVVLDISVGRVLARDLDGQVVAVVAEEDGRIAEFNGHVVRQGDLVA
jgi:hypothetical protein